MKNSATVVYVTIGVANTRTFHSKRSCYQQRSHISGDKTRRIATLKSEALSAGLEHCSKCW